MRDVVVVFHLFRTEGFYRDLLSLGQLGNRVSHHGRRPQMDIELFLLIRLQNKMGTDDRATGGRFTRSRLDLDEFSGKRNNFWFDRLPRDTCWVAYSLLGMSRWCDNGKKHGSCCQKRYKVSHDDSPIGSSLR